MLNIVSESFCGSGTKLLVAQGAERRCREVETALLYVYVAVKRFWKNLHNKPVTLMASSQSCEAMGTEHLGIEEIASHG